MADLPELKTQRFREVKTASGRTRKVAEAFFVPGPNGDDYPGKFICKGGPGLGPIPKEGRWYDVTVYLLKAVRNGDAAEGTPPDKTPKKPPKRKAEAKE